VLVTRSCAVLTSSREFLSTQHLQGKFQHTARTTTKSYSIRTICSRPRADVNSSGYYCYICIRIFVVRSVHRRQPAPRITFATLNFQHSKSGTYPADTIIATDKENTCSNMGIGTRRHAMTGMGACTLLPVVLWLAIASTTSIAFAFSPAVVGTTLHSMNLNRNPRTYKTNRSQAPARGVRCGSWLWDSASASATTNTNEPYVPASLYTADSNDQRYSASDWFHNIITLPRSSILKEIKGPVLSITLWSALVSIVHQTLLHHNMLKAAKAMTMTNKPHSFLVSALGLLLVFRTNSAYQKFAVRSSWVIVLHLSWVLLLWVEYMVLSPSGSEL
jgi:Bestrophin, RFP-TM, chloride channel